MIAVIAGTPTDTQMGVDLLKKYGRTSRGYFVSKTPMEQSLLQVVYPEKLENLVRQVMTEAKTQGAEALYVYCNSLAAAVDLKKLAQELSLPLITPLMVYEKMGVRYQALGVIAANNQSTHGIERAIQTENPAVHVIGTGMLKLVDAVEERLKPEEILSRYQVEALLGFYQNAGCEAVILGCTHFSYFYDALCKCSPLPVIDPGYEMMRMLP